MHIGKIVKHNLREPRNYSFLAAATYTTVATVPAVRIMTAKDLENTCKQAVIVGTVISNVALLPVHAIGMFVVFTKLNTLFNPKYLSQIQRATRLAQRN
jgi:Na+/pantothenate symporter